MSEDDKLLKEAKKLPWDVRLAHKNWKVRNDANIDLAGLCDSILDPKDPRLRELGSLFRKSLADSNAPCQEKALDALLAYLRAADTDAARYAKEVCDVIVVKCLTGRPKTIEKAQAAFLSWVELEAVEAFLDAMEKAIKAKVAKAVVPAIDVMYQAVSLFGTKVVPAKKILKMLPELFDHQDQNVRASAKGLTIELCRWIGKDPVKSILLEKMRDTMKKELEAEVDNVVGNAKPTRKIRSEQAKEIEQELEQVDSTGPVNEAAADGPQDVDEYELVDPVDILTPLGKSTFWKNMKAVKWSERRDAVAELTQLATAKRLATGDYTEVIRGLKKLITDVNIAVAVEAVQATGNLATGLRKDFTGGSRLLLPVLLEKLKEKKQVMTEALTHTLQAMHKSGCIVLSDVVEDVKVATKNKVPTVRSSCLSWVTHCIECSSRATVLKLHKDYVPVFMESLNDGTPEVRDAAFLSLAAIAKMVGMKPLERSLEKLDDVRKNKLIELIGPGGGGNAPASAPVPSRALVVNGVSSHDDACENGGGKRSAASLLSGKRAAPLAAKRPVPAGPVAAKKGEGINGKKVEGGIGPKTPQGADAIQDIEPGDMSLDDIEARVSTLFEPDVIPNLKSAVWSVRLEAVVSVRDTVEGLTNINEQVELLIRLLSVLPGWAEKNVQVQQKIIEAVTLIAQKSTSFSKRCVVICLSGVVERVPDLKTRLQATKCLTAFCEAVGTNFIFKRLLSVIKEHKNPKVQSEGLAWMVTAVEDFGIAHIQIKEIIDFCKDIGLQSSTPGTRNASVKLIGVLHKFVGPDIKGFLSDVKPALQSALDAEYEKNPYEGPAVAPKRLTRAVDDEGAASGGGANGLPREDISGKLTAGLINDLSSPSWKVRQDSIEVINRIIEEAHKRIQATGTGELLGALKGRLNDSNKNLVMMALATLGNLALAMGPAIDKQSKGIMVDVLKCLRDNKKLVREAVSKTLDSWVMVFEVDKLLVYIIPALGDPKICAEGRKDLFDWLTRQVAKPGNQAGILQLVKPTAIGLQDKSAEIRKAAEALLVEIHRKFRLDLVMKAAKGSQSSALSAIQSVLDKQKSPGEEVAVGGNAGLKAGSSNGKPAQNGSGASSRLVYTVGACVNSKTSSDKGDKASLCAIKLTFCSYQSAKLWYH